MRARLQKDMTQTKEQLSQSLSENAMLKRQVADLQAQVSSTV